MVMYRTHVPEAARAPVEHARFARTPATLPRLRILYVQPAEVFGGAERQGVLHIAELARHGFEVVPVVGPGRAITDALETAGVHDYEFLDHLTHESDAPMGTLGTLAFAARATSDWLATQRSLARIARQRHVDLVFASRAVGWIAASAVARRLGLPLVWRGGGRITSPLEVSGMRLLVRALRPDLLLANCEAVRSDFAPLIRAPSRILRNGVDVTRFDPARVRPRFRRELGIAADTPVIGFPSRPAPGKGMELLARVVERTARELPTAVFLVAGEFGWRRHYEEMMAARGLGERVRFIGHVSDVESFHASCDVVVLTSRAHSIEGSPNTVLEAMAMERPVVATDVGGVAEALRDGVEGFLVPDENADRFAARLVQLLASAPLRRMMGRAGRATIVERFHHEKVVAELAGILREVHSAHGQPQLMHTLAG